MNLTLWGAYHRSARPLEQRSLAVHLSFDRVTLDAVIDAEDLAAHSPVQVEARRDGLVVRYRMKFSDDGGVPCAIDLVQRLDEWTLRGWTELAGTLARDGEAWGRACIRLDYRDVDPKQLWTLAASIRIIFKYDSLPGY